MTRCYCGLDFFPKNSTDTEQHLASQEHRERIAKINEKENRCENK